MKTKHIENRNFACVSEAVAHYHGLGFRTFDIPNDLDCRYMRNGNQEVRIRHNGLLDVDTSLIEITV